MGSVNVVTMQPALREAGLFLPHTIPSVKCAKMVFLKVMPHPSLYPHACSFQPSNRPKPNLTEPQGPSSFNLIPEYPLPTYTISERCHFLISIYAQRDYTKTISARSRILEMQQYIPNVDGKWIRINAPEKEHNEK